MTFTLCPKCHKIPCNCIAIVEKLKKVFHTIKDLAVGLTVFESAKTQERKKFVHEHKAEIGEQYAGELWDKINAL